MSDEQSWLPEPDEASRPYFDAMREGKLRLQCCGECGRWVFPVVDRCPGCGSLEVDWRDASGRGTVYSHANLRREYHPRHAGRLPLVIAWIDLDEGVRMASNIVDSDPSEVRVGQSVDVTFERFPDGTLLPVFRIRAE